MAVSWISTSYVAGAPSLIASPQLLRAHRTSSLQIPRRSLAIAATAADDSPPPRRRRRMPPTIEEKIWKFPSVASIVENFDRPLMVEFYTTWCVPCQLLGQNFFDAARLAIEHVQFLRMDLDKNRGLAAELGIKAVPTYIIFRNGEEIDRFEGAQTREYFVNRLQRALKQKEASNVKPLPDILQRPSPLLLHQLTCDGGYRRQRTIEYVRRMNSILSTVRQRLQKSPSPKWRQMERMIEIEIERESADLPSLI